MAVSRTIHARITLVLAGSLGADEHDITPGARLQEDLGAESIDFLDIVFRLEREFGIHIPRGELFPEAILGDNKEFVQEGRITDEGMALLRLRMPYAELDSLGHDRRFGAVADLFTVGLIARYVEWKLGQGSPSRN